MAYGALGLGAGYVVNKAKPLVWAALGAGAYYVAETAREKNLKELQRQAAEKVSALLKSASEGMS